jgi:hypothetical protein
MKFVKLSKKNLLPFVLGGIISLFFCLTAIYTLKYTSPFCRADDWRFIKIFLMPFMKGDFDFRQLWSDPTHPDPIMAILFILNAKLFNLQMNYSALGGIIFQFGSMIILIIGLVKSLYHKEKDCFNILLATIIFCLLLFSFNYTSQYEWYLVTKNYFDYFLAFILVLLINNYAIKRKEDKTILLPILIINFFHFIFSYHLAIFTNFIFYIIFIVIKLLDKNWNKRALTLLVIFISSFIASKVFLSFMILTGNSYQSLILNNAGLLLFNFFKTLQSVGIAYLSGIFNFEFLFKFGIPLKLWEILSFPILTLFLLDLLLFFKQRIYQKSIFPGFLMLLSIVFIGSVMLIRYNPSQSSGIWCLNVPRYVIIYQIGLIGFFWNIFLIVEDFLLKHPKAKMGFQIFTINLLIFIALNWGFHLQQSLKRAQYLLQVYYPETLEKMKNPDISIVNQTISGKKATIETLSFIKENSLNIYSPDFPFQLQPDTLKIKN